MLGHLTNPRGHSDDREFAREFVRDVSAGGPGGSYGLARGRYVVGGWANALVLRKGAGTAERLDAALLFVANHSGPFGYWTDDNGRTWLDVVIATDDRVTANRWAIQNGELAIYDRELDRVLQTEV